MKDLSSIVQELDQCEQERVAGHASPLTAGKRREELLAAALRLIGTKHGVTFVEPLVINSRGDFSLNLEGAADGARYGDGLVSILNQFKPRCGLQAGPFLQETSSWCYMNHFEVERLVRHCGASHRPDGEVLVKLVDNSHGFDDYDVSGHSDIHRLCVPPGLRKGDYFNVYREGGRKTGARWRGSLEATLHELLGGQPVRVDREITESPDAEAEQAQGQRN